MVQGHFDPLPVIQGSLEGTPADDLTRTFRSPDFVAGTSGVGWEISSAGTAELEAVLVRGNVSLIGSGVFRTAESGQRIEMTRTNRNELRFYTGQAGEVVHGFLDTFYTASTGPNIRLETAQMVSGGAGGRAHLSLIGKQLAADGSKDGSWLIGTASGLDTYAAIWATANGTTGFLWYFAGGGTAYHEFRTGAVASMVKRFKITLGVEVGAPTGGDKGAGTINAAADIYKNNSAYTNPDWILELWATGRIKKYQDRAPEGARLISIREVAEHARANHRLPGITDDPAGMFARGDIALEWVERLLIYTVELEERITELEEGIAPMRCGL